MTSDFLCYRCGNSLANLTLPLSRYDECPSCTVPLRVCRMCKFFDAGVPRKCTQDDAEEVIEKERLNFCDWFEPGVARYDGKAASEEARARAGLATLFGDNEATAAETDPGAQDAEDLFK